MGEYRAIKLVNRSLSIKDFKLAAASLRRYDKFIETADTLFFGEKCTTNQQYGVDVGALTSEYNAARLAIKHYLGDFAGGVEII